MNMIEINSKLLPFVEKKANKIGMSLDEYIATTDSRFAIKDGAMPVLSSFNTCDYRVFMTEAAAKEALADYKHWYTVITESEAIRLINNTFKPRYTPQEAFELRRKMSNKNNNQTVIFTF